MYSLDVAADTRDVEDRMEVGVVRHWYLSGVEARTSQRAENTSDIYEVTMLDIGDV